MVSHGWPVVVAVQLRNGALSYVTGVRIDIHIRDCKAIPGRSLAPVLNPGQGDALQAVAHTIPLPHPLHSSASCVDQPSGPAARKHCHCAPNDPHSPPACPSSESGQSATAYWRST